MIDIEIRGKTDLDEGFFITLNTVEVTPAYPGVEFCPGGRSLSLSSISFTPSSVSFYLESP